MEYMVPDHELSAKFITVFQDAVNENKELACFTGRETRYRINTRDSFMTDISDPETIMEQVIYPLYIREEKQIKDRLESWLLLMALGEDVLAFYQVFRFAASEDILHKAYEDAPFHTDFSGIVPVLLSRLEGMKDQLLSYREGAFASYQDTMWDRIERIIGKSDVFKCYREGTLTPGIKVRASEICANIGKRILNGAKVPHSTSQPVIYEENGTYYLAVFVFFYGRADIEAGMVDRPSVWAVADLKTGEIIREYQCREKDFSDAAYDHKYHVRSDATYDTSKAYYDEAFAILDSVRNKIITSGKLYRLEYQYYLKRIIANIPAEYQRFYTDLSV